MTAAQLKAQELIEKFKPLVWKGSSEYLMPQAKEAKKNSKQCAAICVQEIIKTVEFTYNSFFNDKMGDIKYYPPFQYWNEVLTSINQTT